MKCVVMHALSPTFRCGDETILQVSDYSAVAEIHSDRFIKNEDALGAAFMLTNTIQKPWWEDPLVRFLGSPDYGMEGCRSTSVGDVIVIEPGLAYRVESVGFKRVTLREDT